MQSEFFKQVTIFFSDIANFHRITMTVAPMELVRILNNLYTSMDDVIDNYDVYKVETINDSYMVASGMIINHLRRCRAICSITFCNES